MSIILEQKISNHPLFNDVERYVVVKRIANNADVKQIVIDAEIKYIQNGNDISKNFKTKIENWIVTNNYKVYVRDEENNKIPNPDFNPETDPEEEGFLRQPAFDYFQSLLLQNQVPLLTLISTNILNDDEINSFDF